VSIPERQGLQRTLQGATQTRMLREFADALEVLTRRCPVVLVLEDLHWSDTSTVALLTYVAQRRDLARLLVLGTYRPVDVLASAHPLHGAVQELQARGSCQVLRLDCLHTGDVEAYVRGRLTREALPPDIHHLVTAIHQRTGGNPLFMVTVLEHLLQEGVIAVREGQWHVSHESRTVREEIPDSLRQLIEKQFAGLRPEEQQLLEGASVAGYEFAVAAVAAGLGQPADAVETTSAALAAKQQFIRATGVEAWPDGTLAGRYCFVHALYHQTLYDRRSQQTPRAAPDRRPPAAAVLDAPPQPGRHARDRGELRRLLPDLRGGR
jgi:predicted ATPase